MKKLKKIWNENKILFVLFLILIVCFVAICLVVFSYFMGTNKSVYGNRLKDHVKISDNQEKDYITAITSDDMVIDSTWRKAIKTIYITIKFNETASLVEAESKAVSSLSNIEDEILNYYDINFILIQDKVESDETKGFTVMGSSNVNGNGVVWGNNTEIIEEEE